MISTTCKRSRETKESQLHLAFSKLELVPITKLKDQLTTKIRQNSKKCAPVTSNSWSHCVGHAVVNSVSVSGTPRGNSVSVLVRRKKKDLLLRETDTVMGWRSRLLLPLVVFTIRAGNKLLTYIVFCFQLLCSIVHMLLTGSDCVLCSYLVNIQMNGVTKALF